MKIGVPRETHEGEARVGATPKSVKRYTGEGLEVLVEDGAGGPAAYPNQEYEEAGAKVVSGDEAWSADIIVKVACPSAEEVGRLREGALLVSLLDPFGAGKEIIPKLAQAKVTAVAMEMIPRITRAQSMDVLSSQANIAGYKAVIEAAHHFRKLLPMMMTAAGSVPPAKVIVLGAGVAGLQAIATARRLGAQVEAFDVRPEVREEIESVGAKFLDLGLEESGAGEGGYAKELTEEGKQRQQDALTRTLPKGDIIITTAQIPGRPAPVLITEEAVKNMRHGSVIVDLAAGSGGNCPLSEPDRVIERHGVTLIGHTNLPSMLPNHSSRFFARNLRTFVELALEKDEGGAHRLKIDFEDEIIDGAVVAHAGEQRWPKPKSGGGN